MRAGELDRQVTVQRKSVTIDTTYGTEVVTWIPLSLLPGSPEVAERFWAQVLDVLPSKAETVLRADLAIARNPVRVRMRWRDDIDSSMRIVVHDDTDRTLQIIAGPAALGGRKDGIELMCEEVTT
jgi:head-tail adaptor